jgi:hypothetical protein
LYNLSLDDSLIASQHLDRGMAYHKQNMLHEALFEYDTALSLMPNDRYAHWNRATTLLALGEYEEGFREHDWAWKLFDWRGFGPVRDDMDRIRHLPIWGGEDISSAKLLVYHELGFGDGIQTLRYLPELRSRAAHVTLVINVELVRLAAPFGVEVVDKVPVDVSDYDYRLPFFGVMSALKTTLHNIPNKPYISSTLTRARYFEKPRVGICWSGRTQTTFTLNQFLSKLDHAGFKLYSLQLGPVDEGVVSLDSKDFADTVDVIAQMDHVVTVDSAPAHLAGAMGHRSVHLLLPYLCDWRWWFTNSWYPTIRTYKQVNVGEWDMPFERLNAALKGSLA